SPGAGRDAGTGETLPASDSAAAGLTLDAGTMMGLPQAGHLPRLPASSSFPRSDFAQWGHGKGVLTRLPFKRSRRRSPQADRRSRLRRDREPKSRAGVSPATAAR